MVKFETVVTAAVWLSLVLIFIYVSSISLGKLLNPGVVTVAWTETNTEMEFPSVAICHKTAQGLLTRGGTFEEVYAGKPPVSKLMPWVSFEGY